MSSKRNNENFLQGGGDEETRCLLHTFTDVKKESVSSEETKNHDKGKLGSRGQQDEETVVLLNLIKYNLLVNKTS